MAYNLRDHFYKKAKVDNYAARSAYKLEEMQKRFRILKQGQKILDLGAAPGSWSQYASKVIGGKGRILGIDLQKILITLPNAMFIEADLRELNLDESFIDSSLEPPFDLVMSDMAPRTTGHKLQDQMRSLDLCELALSVCMKYLKKDGVFVCKFFHSEEFENYRKQLRAVFGEVTQVRPLSTRKESKEIFFLAQKFQGPTETK